MNAQLAASFWGTPKISAQRLSLEKPVAQSTVNLDTKPEVAQTPKAQAMCCSLCNVEMSQGKTKFKIDGWEGPQPNGDLGKFGEELPVTVYLCPNVAKSNLRLKKEHQNKEKAAEDLSPQRHFTTKSRVLHGS